MTWTELDVALERFRVTYRITDRAIQEVRSGMLDAGEICPVESRYVGCRDPNDNMFVDVLEQTPAQWICTDDGDLHALGRDEVIGMGELVRLLEED